MPILPRFIYRFNVIAIKILAGFLIFGRNRQADFKFYMEMQNYLHTSQKILKEQIYKIYAIWFQDLQ